ncbi:unnamed protein product [Dracunculus medinensis]|uniref:Zinc metalloproteinase n=1 Tax=Dracunculus medinensis TaxID=318479 RepID=A0A3P7SBP9_DRAME|nr:unnamed protein product [Dracunculus medinensis]
MEKHFGYDNVALDAVSTTLLQLKALVHSQTFGNRVFSRDSAADSKKDVSISVEQPKTTNKLTPYLFEGDILLSKKQADTILENVASKPSRKRNRDKLTKSDRLRRSFSSDPEAKWIEFPIRYRFHESLASGDFIEFFKGEGCYSVVGRFGGRQGLSVGEGCERIGTIEHEIGHALGVWHQQSRPDAKKYIEVLKEFILPSYISEFLERGNDEIDTLGIPYDLGSIMHYGSTAFSADQKSKTVLTRDPFYQKTIGQREALSFYDIMTINEAYCKDRCKKGETECLNGGYAHPSNCKICICPNGFSGKKCEKNEKPLATDCGGMLKATDEWQEIESPGYPDPGYESGEKCSWLIEAAVGKRIEVEFIEDFGIFCASTCVDYVELKIGNDMRATGFRICCFDKPKDKLISLQNKIMVIFRSAVGEDIGFKLQFRQTKKLPKMADMPQSKATTGFLKHIFMFLFKKSNTNLKISLLSNIQVATTTIAGENIWSEWGPWSDCSRPCGGCGIRSRVRICATAQCYGKGQEFSTCNLIACPVDPKCSKVKFLNRICVDSRVCTHLSDAINSCSQPSCCPPFYAVNGMCQSDEPVLSSFVF